MYSTNRNKLVYTLSLSLSLSPLSPPLLQLSALLRVATLTDHQFIFHHLLRSPPGVGKWGAPYLHLLSPLQTKQLLTAQYHNRGVCVCVCVSVCIHMCVTVCVYVCVIP
jgi:hypothetical protein